MDKFVCHYCKDELTKEEITKDHIFPKSKIKKIVENGENLPENVDIENNCVISCFPCNFNKGTKDYDSFLSLGIKQIKHLKKIFLYRQIKNKKKGFSHKKRF